MQYVLLPASEDQYFLADCKEIIAIKEGVIDESDVDGSQCTYRLLYGAYKPQPHANYTAEDVRAHITEAIDQQLIHIAGKNVINLKIEGVVISDSVIKHQCRDLQHPRKTQDVAFAALVKAPAVFEIDNRNYQTATAYLRWDGVDAITALQNRKGLFAFTSEDKRFTRLLQEERVSNKSWRNHIDHLRMLKEAHRAQ